MITVTVYGETYECETAYKGSDYIRLMDANGLVSASFTGISAFSGFSIEGGSWSTPAKPDNSPIMVAMDDGSIANGSSTCNDVSNALATASAAETIANQRCLRAAAASQGRLQPPRAVIPQQLGCAISLWWMRALM